MSIRQSKTDLQQIVTELTSTPPATALELTSFLQDNLLPWLEALTHEVGEMDQVIEDLVHESVDVLHSDNAAVFAGVIAGGLALATELATRIGGDQRLLAVIRDFRQLAVQAKEILEEIVIPDDEEEEEDEDEDEDDKPPPIAEKAGGA
jgi:hypothetical protein